MDQRTKNVMMMQKALHSRDDVDRLYVSSTRNNKDNVNKNNLKTKKGKKNNCMDISSDKQAEFHTRKFERSKGSETLREKQSLF